MFNTIDQDLLVVLILLSPIIGLLTVFFYDMIDGIVTRRRRNKRKNKK